MDFETEQLWELYKHVFPGFNENHVLVYRSLWCIEPKTAEQLISETSLSRATVFKALSDLMREGLVRKNNFRPVGYHATDPLKAYSSHSRRVSLKLKNGSRKVDSLIRNSSGLSGELYLIKRDGGQQRLISRATRQAILSEDKLIELRKAVDAQLQQVGQQKLKAWEICR